MARVVGIDLPREKKIRIGLTYIYGIGQATAVKVLDEANVNADMKVKDLTGEEISRIAEVIQREYTIEGNLRREVSSNIKRLISTGTYRGMRHRRGLPVRGQRTSTNARTCKGPRRTVGVRRKESVKKMEGRK
ncbi:30S ribosomal protein S13 [candidate division NPL-UPA2 bacterium Unc8]|uniref:Small ribosomal subunit protein uS13 n=1 Tax=candidate division NPL-UPA2 bacterium Unc8 TaxID=1980939 RepID=A0A399FYK6_UNCN2|nr:30S ribosomal protein S13 [Bacillota bacterium]MBT9138174.1 30S ribosomal protein S13 [Bacillota bacterium]MBT9146847.1 30S ribosomal protein S13 [Bacillota bacterium]RII00283.1 MAG: 30S ribosomal protein S13 [candidate division NPL-UPA2 bacterium Unc8]